MEPASSGHNKTNPFTTKGDKELHFVTRCHGLYSLGSILFGAGHNTVGGADLTTHLAEWRSSPPLFFGVRGWRTSSPASALPKINNHQLIPMQCIGELVLDVTSFLFLGTLSTYIRLSFLFVPRNIKYCNFLFVPRNIKYLHSIIGALTLLGSRCLSFARATFVEHGQFVSRSFAPVLTLTEP